MRDVAILVADSGLREIFRSFFGRTSFHESLECGEFDFDPQQDLIMEPGETDGAVYKRAHKLLAPMRATHRRAVVVLDREWDGKRQKTADRIRQHIERNLERQWDEFAVVVIDPELERWIWATTVIREGHVQVHPHVVQCLCYQGDAPLRQWLNAEGLWPDDDSKPTDPKEAYQRTIKFARKNGAGIRPSNAIFGKIVSRISPSVCTDQAFLDLRDKFRKWFGGQE